MEMTASFRRRERAVICGGSSFADFDILSLFLDEMSGQLHQQRSGPPSLATIFKPGVSILLTRLKLDRFRPSL